MVSRDRMWGAVVVTALSFPLSCAMGGGLATAHDARRSPSQEHWQMPLAYCLAIAGIVAAYTCIKLLKIVAKGDDSPSASKYVRIAALNPMIGGVVMVGVGIVNVTGGGAALMLLGLISLGFGIWLVTNREHSNPDT
ncbi:MAG: hypothetical protein ABL962_06995 [Fimbriimonadaceae bacterium]